MRLIQPCYELTLSCVRRYVELGVNHPQRFIRTIPYTSFRAPLARKGWGQPVPTSCPKNQRQPATYTDKTVMAGYLENFRTAINGSEFTASDMAEHFLNLGWQVNHPIQAAGTKLRTLYFNDQVEEVRHEPRNAGHGKSIIWKFKNNGAPSTASARNEGGTK